MSKVKISPNASGTGIFSITAPATNTDRTLTLPDVDATVMTTAGGTFTGNLGMPINSNINFSGNWGFKVGYQDNQGGDHYYYINKRSNTVETQVMKIHGELGTVNLPMQPSFCAYGNGGNQAISNGAAIVLTQTNRNNGSCYSTSNGRFTAPVAGFYQFSYGAYSYSSAQFAFKVNGSDWTPSDSIGLITITANELGSCSIGIYLNANDYVQFGLRNGYAVNVYTSHSWFSGYLVG